MVEIVVQLIQLHSVFKSRLLWHDLKESHNLQLTLTEEKLSLLSLRSVIAC